VVQFEARAEAARFEDDDGLLVETLKFALARVVVVVVIALVVVFVKSTRNNNNNNNNSFLL
jgi:heme/copper-type cytochrome/quinol oxidase subunit 2